MARVGDRGVDDLADFNALARSDEAVGLDPRQAHQILDDPQHPPRLVADRAAESRSQFVRQVAFVGERLGIAEHGRQGRAQLVARIGDEIDPHLFRRHGVGAVDHAHQRSIRPQTPDDQPPRAAGLGDAGRVDLARAVREDQLERLRMTDREADVAAFDASAEQLARRRIGETDDASFDDQRRLVERIDQSALISPQCPPSSARVAD